MKINNAIIVLSLIKLAVIVISSPVTDSSIQNSDDNSYTVHDLYGNYEEENQFVNIKRRDPKGFWKKISKPFVRRDHYDDENVNDNDIDIDIDEGDQYLDINRRDTNGSWNKINRRNYY